MSEILVVSAGGPERLGMLAVLQAAGHHVRAAASFDEAACLLAKTAPDLVIADERLHAYNGMHLLLRARAENPQVGAVVVIAQEMRDVEDDARRLNLQCTVRPQNPADWVAFVSRSLHADRPDRSSAAAMDSIHTH